MNLPIPDGTAIFVKTFDGRPVYSGVVAGTFEGRYVVRPDSPELEETTVPPSFVEVR